MAVISLLLGGATGFLSALVALFVFDANWLSALGIWSGAGLLIGLALIGLSRLARRPALVLSQARA